ncbi:hypothetical protein ACFE04_007180 [Oxalis oulophora]
MKIVDPISPCQVAFFLGIIPVIASWIYAEILEHRKNTITKSHSDVALTEIGKETVQEEDRAILLEGGGLQSASPRARVSSSAWSPIVRFLTMDETFLIDNRLTLRAMSEFGVLLSYYYLCDRTDFFASSTKVLFLMYHYFAATEIYNAIRIFIAAYVWMTGFGNFSYYYIRKDFSLARFAQMMWRLNFLVIFCCIILNNSYMLYYICPMHTLFTLMVYGALGILNKYNEIGSVIAAKIAACFLVVILVWEIPGVFEFLWGPFTFFLGYTDPAKPNLSRLHEWHFRSGLDRYIWIIGMIYAYYHPTVERWMEKLEEAEVKRRISIKSAVALIAIVVGYLWFEYIYKLDKITYNNLLNHCPVDVELKQCLHMFAECHATVKRLQFDSIRMAWKSDTGNLHLTISYLVKVCCQVGWYAGPGTISSVPDGQPKLLLCLIPDYPLLNFMLTTAIYVAISYRLFELTNTLKTAFVPSKDDKRLMNNAIMGIGAFTVLYTLAFAFVSIPAMLTMKFEVAISCLGMEQTENVLFHGRSVPLPTTEDIIVMSEWKH